MFYQKFYIQYNTDELDHKDTLAKRRDIIHDFIASHDIKANYIQYSCLFKVTKKVATIYNLEMES